MAEGQRARVLEGGFWMGLSPSLCAGLVRGVGDRYNSSSGSSKRMIREVRRCSVEQRITLVPQTVEDELDMAPKQCSCGIITGMTRSEARRSK